MLINQSSLMTDIIIPTSRVSAFALLLVGHEPIPPQHEGIIRSSVGFQSDSTLKKKKKNLLEASGLAR